MKLQRVTSVLILCIVMIVAGCTPAAPETEAATQPPPTRVESTETDSPPNTEVPTLVATTSPTMEVGLTYYYVDGTTLVAVPSGEFLMGADGQDNPEHTVTLGDYWIYSTKVTNRQYALCEELGECAAPDLEDNPNYQDTTRANDPVVGVTYDQAVAYCSFVQGRLPTEAEWEKASRNPDGSPYPWGDTAPSCDLANFKECVGGTTNVINYQTGASFYGVLDVVGNTFEWVADWYAADYYSNSPGENPQGPESGTTRTIRSSSYASNAEQLSVTNRETEDPQNHRADLGFRCIVEDPTYFAAFCESPLVYRPDANAAAQPAETCPALNITQAPYCSGDLPLTNITFSGPPDASIDYANCTPSGNSNLVTCQSPETIVSITASCQLSLTGNPACPGGYTQQDNQCVANGSAGQCLIGNYDSAQQCCTIQNSTELASISHICPAGTFYSNSEDACLAYPVKEIVSVSAEVDLIAVASCIAANSGNNSGGGGGGGGGEEGSSTSPAPTVPSCAIGDWDPGRNCCVFLEICYG
ncbi:MAG TPA: SUMF1/EgtB/PvdO family nonheme iron enzyme [Anaerolineales bacterium]|nr:SUMF1/EgtB/PvdO family nonheme iron enzyme [Anaerolineales bacterium]